MVPLWMLCSWFCMQQVNDHWSHQRANTDFSLTKVLGVRYGLYKFILPFLFYFTFFEMLQLHARSNNHETAWWILKIFEGGLWLMLIYFFSELRSGMNCPAWISKIFHETHCQVITTVPRYRGTADAVRNPYKEQNFYQNTPDGANVRIIIIFQWCYLFAVSHVWLLKWDNVSNRKTFQTKQQITISIILCDLLTSIDRPIYPGVTDDELGSMDILTVHIFIWNKLMNKCSCCSPMILIS